ncbi:MAG: cytochrome c [Bryobacteraceae bacterium]|nr:cytochrome c [Bryobacteraceae bacterium]
MKIVAFAAPVLAASMLMAADKPGDAGKGKEVFAANCVVCHNADNNVKKTGPGLKGLYKRDKLNSGAKVTDAAVMKVINEGVETMPAYSDILSDEERRHVLAYLKTL